MEVSLAESMHRLYCPQEQRRTLVMIRSDMGARPLLSWQVTITIASCLVQNQVKDLWLVE
ncbi:MAG: hypothetical protein MHM6MM_004244 [Cercozoa sp. M6MM]